MLEKIVLFFVFLGWLLGCAILILSLTSDTENFAEFPKLYTAWFGFSFLIIIFIIIRKLKSKKNIKEKLK